MLHHTSVRTAFGRCGRRGGVEQINLTCTRTNPSGVPPCLSGTDTLGDTKSAAGIFFGSVRWPRLFVVVVASLVGPFVASSVDHCWVFVLRVLRLGL